MQWACPLGTAITGPVGYSVSGDTAILTPASPLPANTSCTATISTGVKDATALAMSSPYTWTFKTGAAPDTTPPTVSSTFPIANATDVAFNTSISASFSEPMDPLSLSTKSVTLACPTGTPVVGTVSYRVIGNVAVLVPTAVLPASTTCTATIAAGVRDVLGNGLQKPFTWDFKTGAAPDTTAPTVVTTLPTANANNVAFNTLITATFSEAMDPLSINVTNMKLACPASTRRLPARWPIGSTAMSPPLPRPVRCRNAPPVPPRSAELFHQALIIVSAILASAIRMHN